MIQRMSYMNFYGADVKGVFHSYFFALFLLLFLFCSIPPKAENNFYILKSYIEFEDSEDRTDGGGGSLSQ